MLLWKLHWGFVSLRRTRVWISFSIQTKAKETYLLIYFWLIWLICLIWLIYLLSHQLYFRERRPKKDVRKFGFSITAWRRLFPIVNSRHVLTRFKTEKVHSFSLHLFVADANSSSLVIFIYFIKISLSLDISYFS